MSDAEPIDAVLGDEALKNLTGFFDVLIRMDLEQKAKDESDSSLDQMSK